MSSAPGRGRTEDQLTGPRAQPCRPELLPPVSAHRRLRGPYTATGTVMRALVPDALRRFPELVAGHRLEIVSAAPELGPALGMEHAVKSATSPDQDTTRFFSRLRTLRLAHGLAEFVRDYAAAAGDGPWPLTVAHAAEADPTDQEFFAVLERRASAHVTLITDQTVETCLAPNGAETDSRSCTTALTTDRATELATRYVDGDCLNPDPAAHAAYLKLPAAVRRELHDRRAAALVDTGDYSLRLGVIPYHRERGSDPATAVAALHEAMHYCVDLGFYHAGADLARRGRALVGWQSDAQTRSMFTNVLATAHIALAEPDQAAALYEEIRRNSSEPSMHMSAAYSTGILLTRHYPEDRRDHDAARGWLNEAVAFSGLLPDSPRLALQKMFNNVGLALVENHLGNWPTALERTSDALTLLPPGADSDEYRLHRSALHLRRVQTYRGMDDQEAAVAEYRKVLDADPDYPEYHLEFGTMLRELGREGEALAEYESAIRLSPPFAEAYYNRADVRAARGDLPGAAEDYRYVVDLTPENLDAHLNLASVLDELGEAEAASAAVDAGLALAPDDAHLLCLRGQLDVAAERYPAAEAALDAALAADPTLAAAWAARGELAYAIGDLAGAVADLTRAWHLNQDVEILFNRAVVHQELGDFQAAIDDFDQVLAQDPEEQESRRRRAACLAAQAAPAHRDQSGGSSAAPGSPSSPG